MNDGSKPTDATVAFAERAQTEHGESIRHLVVFGGDAPAAAEAELLVVLDDLAVEHDIEALAREVGRERGVVLTVYVLPSERVDPDAEQPLVREAFEEGHVYV
jgi:hypothetical protein